MELIGILQSWFSDLRLIAEDLGYTTPEVEKLLRDSKLPGMKILEFGFDPTGDSLSMPHNCEYNSVCYVGTHDNEVIRGWVENTPKEVLHFASAYLQRGRDESWCHALLRAGMSTPSRLFVAQMQDLLELPA